MEKQANESGDAVDTAFVRWSDWQQQGRYWDEWGNACTVRVAHGHVERSRPAALRRDVFGRLLLLAFHRGAWNEATAFVLGNYDSLTQQSVSARACQSWREPAARRYFVDLTEPILQRAFEEGLVTLEYEAPLAAAELDAPDTDRSPAAPPREVEPNWFEVQVVDDVGDGVSGVLLHFSGGVAPMRTDARGVARLEEQAPGAVDVRLADVEGVRAALQGRWATPRPRELPEGELVRVTSIERADESWTMLHSRSYVWALLPPGREATFVELEDALFRTDSAVPMPSFEDPLAPVGAARTTTALVLALALRFNDEHQPKKLLVAGHTDGAGSEKHNDQLSRERAECVLALLSGKRDRFAELADARHTVADAKHWLTWVAEQFPASFDCAPPKVDDSAGTLPPWVTSFQTSYNDARSTLEAAGGSLDADGDMGPLTWGALFDVFEAALRRELDEPASEVASLRARLVPLAGDLAFVGFGEHCSVDAAHRGAYRSQANRRVELVFFDPGEEPNLDALRSAPGSSELYDPEHYRRVPLPPETSAKRNYVVWAATEPIVIDDGTTTA